MKERPLRVCITGPTATGKTDAAVAVCRAVGGEVLSMDSMQIYERLSIGTAKPTEAEMGGVPHHLLSFVAPEMKYTVADYQRDARDAAQRVEAGGRVPVYCGGTGLYLQAVSRPLTFSDAYDAGAVRAALTIEAEAPGGPEKLYARLQAIDPLSAERLEPGNLRRVIRALEIHQLTGELMSARQAEWEAEPVEDFLIFALTMPREKLYARINERVDRMIAQGLPDEVHALLASGLSRDTQAMQAIGYREMARALAGECEMEEAVAQIKQNSRRYAKRQLTWLKRDARVMWVDVSTFASVGEMHGFLIAGIREKLSGK